VDTDKLFIETLLKIWEAFWGILQIFWPFIGVLIIQAVIKKVTASGVYWHSYLSGDSHRRAHKKSKLSKDIIDWILSLRDFVKKS